MRISSLRLLSLVWIVCLMFTGCGGADHPPLGYVSGTVTMDGEPLEGLLVLFKPADGRAASGVTDGEGKYSLEYTYGVAGAKTGPATVMFEWPLGTKNAKPLADRYTTKSDQKVEIKSGSNTFDFDLKSDPKAPPVPVGAD